ncbi:FGFR1 oncogene partner isoform X7 [Labrus bergylta]|uniref:FGFR1 oncogene partner isoform X7 n=1 Tax=Labrus bergylta TaxID=56723 RepID=UPI0009B3FB88|nr:FGFR1 oncogene partner isoform X5 [Labrus bergylta]
MSATEDDTELRDLLIQNLENSGVLNKLKAEMRAAVFLAMEEQDRLENKSPLINENLKKLLNTKDGRLVAALMMDFLQVFNLDFTLAVFQPEINSLNGLDGRDLVCRDLGLSESDVNRNSPLLLELVRRRHKTTEEDRGGTITKEPTQKQITHAQKKFEFYDKDGSGSVFREDLKKVFTDLFPGLNKSMLERFITDELRAADKTFSKTIDSQQFELFYRRLFSQCRSVVLQDSDVSPGPEESSPAVSKIPRFKGQTLRGQIQTAAKGSEGGESLGKGDSQQQQRGSKHGDTSGLQRDREDLDREDLDREDLEDDPDEGDSFFDDPLPKPQKTYGWKVEASGARESPVGSLSEAPRPRGGGSSVSEQSHSRNGAPRDPGFRDSKTPNDKTGSLHLDDDVEYDDDFNSHRSDLSKSELSIGEEIEEVSIEGPENSDKFDETTQDLSVSQLSQSHGADYMEDVA